LQIYTDNLTLNTINSLNLATIQASREPVVARIDFYIHLWHFNVCDLCNLIDENHKSIKSHELTVANQR
jgi:hypothetical protein